MCNLLVFCLANCCKKVAFQGAAYFKYARREVLGLKNTYNIFFPNMISISERIQAKKENIW